MDETHVKMLQKARAQLVEQRRGSAKVLSEPYDRQRSANARTVLLQAQEAIEAIDRAIEDEKRLEAPEKRKRPAASGPRPQRTTSYNPLRRRDS